MKRRAPAAAAAGLALQALCGGCTVGPDFEPPRVEAPADWAPGARDVRSRTVLGEIDTRWWTGFGDRRLAVLVERLAAQNLDLRTAAERVLQGRAQQQVVASQGLPRLNAQASYARERVSVTGPVTLVTPAPGAPLEYDLFRQGLYAAWELDLFGRIRRGVEAANAGTAAAIEARRVVALSAIADLADNYLRLRGAQARIAITERNLGLARRNTRLVEDRFANGVATTLELAQARAQQATIAQNLPSLRATEAQLINAIGFLLGEQPRALQAELGPRAPQPGVPRVVPVSLPGTLVRQRPDVREAEARLHTATAQAGVATAAFYPDVSLTGNFRLESLRFSDAFSLPSRAFSAGPALYIPLFLGGQLRGTLFLRESQQREAAVAFQKTVLQAWQDVDNALTAYAQAQRRRGQVAEAVRQNAIALGAARDRYSQGAIDFLNVLQVQAALLQSESDLADSDTQIATSLVGLHKALGGGWDVAEPSRQ